MSGIKDKIRTACDDVAAGWDGQFGADDAFQLCCAIIDECDALGKSDIIVSKTGDSEILIYTFRDNGISNVLVDEDLDVSWIFISNNPDIKSSTKFFESPCDYRVSEIASLL